MKHYGDITKLSGYTLPVVDCITGGSPCQDLSVAGKREGLSGKRSGLFMEQVRIIKEMRERDRANGRTGVLVRPRYMVWENVLGAFSSNGGRDFQAVLSEVARIAEPDAPDVPLPDKGRWPHAGTIYQKLGGWSISWRVHDAQFWGVPQRRKRISLVADFGGLSAPAISFERKGLSGDSSESGAERERAPAPAGCGVENTGLRVYGIGGYNSAGMLSPNPRAGIYEADTARTLDLNGGSPACNQDGMAIVTCPEICSTLPARMGGSPCIDRGPPIIAVYENHGQDSRIRELGDICESVSAKYGTGGNNTPIVLSIGNGQLNQIAMSDKANTLDTMHDPQAVLLLHAPDTAHALHAKANCQYREDSETYIVAAVDCRNGTINQEITGTLQAKEQGYNINSNNVVMIYPVVRRLTPLEYERLQGFPDGWTDIGNWTDSKGKTHKAADSPRYKALGNSIALPFWQYLARRICAQYERDITMGSLFDGIGGFPYVFERCGAKAVWASEIEEFPIAVTKKHFPEETQ